MDSFSVIIVSFVCFIVALTFHEFSHALIAYYLGDETAYRHGRLTLNPLAHIDPVGTVILPLIGAISHLPVFGWAKPVPFNPYNVKHGRWGGVAVAMAGPASNFLFAAAALLAIRFLIGAGGLSQTNLLVVFLYILATVNVYLAAFNLIPVPPLDGSRFLEVMLDAPRHRHIRFWLERNGMWLLVGLLMVDYVIPGAPLSRFFDFILNGFFGLFGF